MSEITTPVQPSTPKVDVNRVSDFLSRRFREVTERFPRATRADDGVNATYELQQEFCYRIDEIQRGPAYLAPKLIQQTNGWIAGLGAQR